MSLPKGCVDWLICDWYIMTSFFPNTKIQRIVSPCSCCSQSHQEIHFLCEYLFFWWYDGSAVSDSEGALWNGRDGQGGKDFNSWDGTVTVSWWSRSFQWSFAASCLGPQIRFHPAAADSAHTAHSIFAPQRRSLHTHNTTPKQVPCRASVKNKFENIFANIFMKSILFYDNIWEHSMRSRWSCLVHILHILSCYHNCTTFTKPIRLLMSSKIQNIARHFLSTNEKSLNKQEIEKYIQKKWRSNRLQSILCLHI